MMARHAAQEDRLQRPGPLADVVPQVAREAAGAARVRPRAGEDAVAADHHGGVPQQRPDVLLAPLPVRDHAADRQLAVQKQRAHQVAQVPAAG